MLLVAAARPGEAALACGEQLEMVVARIGGGGGVFVAVWGGEVVAALARHAAMVVVARGGRTRQRGLWLRCSKGFSVVVWGRGVGEWHELNRGGVSVSEDGARRWLEAPAVAASGGGKMEREVEGVFI